MVSFIALDIPFSAVTCRLAKFYGGINTNFFLTGLSSNAISAAILYLDDVASIFINITGSAVFYQSIIYAYNVNNVEIYCSDNNNVFGDIKTCAELGIFV